MKDAAVTILVQEIKWMQTRSVKSRLKMTMTVNSFISLNFPILLSEVRRRPSKLFQRRHGKKNLRTTGLRIWIFCEEYFALVSAKTAFRNFLRRMDEIEKVIID